MKEYINFNTEKRKNSASDFEKGFFKLVINSVYGKNDGKPSIKIFDKNFAAIHENKSFLNNS